MTTTRTDDPTNDELTVERNGPRNAGKVLQRPQSIAVRPRNERDLFALERSFGHLAWGTFSADEDLLHGRIVLVRGGCPRRHFGPR